jgi:adenine-specific DNA-methyltransferase
VYCGVDYFATPFGYRLQRAQGGGEAQSCPIDLIESLIYRLGIAVRHLNREPLGAVVLGDNRRGQSVAVFFRDCGMEGSASWVEQKLAEHPADRVYTNDPARLGFAGCENLEAIEAVFAPPYGRT